MLSFDEPGEVWAGGDVAISGLNGLDRRAERHFSGFGEFDKRVGYERG